MPYHTGIDHRIDTRAAIMAWTVVGLGVVLLLFQPAAKACVLENGNFETGDLSGWTIFQTLNGTLGGEGFPGSVDFDINGDGRVSKSVEFKVGRREYQAKNRGFEGGGIFSTIRSGAGHVTITVDVASSYSSPKDQRNLAGGVFELLLDGTLLSKHDFGPIENRTTERFTLEGMGSVSAGVHEVRVRLSRPFRSLPQDDAPRQYLDNVRVVFTPE